MSGFQKREGCSGRVQKTVGPVLDVEDGLAPSLAWISRRLPFVQHLQVELMLITLSPQTRQRELF